MREIRFRGKWGRDGEWVYGGFVPNLHGKKTVIYNEIEVLGSFEVVRGFSEVIPETVGQYTGLFDRDGQEIYEGDIVEIKLRDNLKKYTHEVGVFRWNEKLARFMWIEKSGEPWSISCDNNMKVIGNIHDNPGLLAEVSE